MRELVYLSDRKLQSFLLERPRRRPPVRIEGEFRIPFVGTIRLAHDPDTGARAPDLDEVITAIGRSDRPAVWFTDESTRPGSWIYFESPLAYTVVFGDGFPDVVLFLDTATERKSVPGVLWDTSPYESISDLGAVRLLLHGSPEHLTSHRGGTMTNIDRPPEVTGSEGPSLDYTLRQLHVDEAVTSAAEHMSASDPVNDIDSLLNHEMRGKTLEEVVRQLVLLVDDDLRHGPYWTRAAWMAGYARVTVIAPPLQRPLGFHHKVVAATPLYIEWISQPDIAGRQDKSRRP